MIFELNPIDVLKRRELKILPPHFLKIKLTDSISIKLTDSISYIDEVQCWVKSRLKGRYCIIQTPLVNASGKIQSTTVVAFEDQKELTYFVLACPHLRRN